MNLKLLFLAFGLILFVGAAYATSIAASNVRAVGGSGQVAVPTGVVQVTGISLYNGATLTTTGAFNNVHLSLTSSVGGTYKVYIAIYVGGVLQNSLLAGTVTLSPSGTLTSSTFAMITPATSLVEVDVTVTT